MEVSFTYDHRTLKTRLPVRSALFKQRTGGLVVRWVTTGESPLLYVFASVFGTTIREVALGGYTLNPWFSDFFSFSVCCPVTI
jgi:hypothetical protein